ncbi:hypothetical protein VW35_19025 [Devosia soli]|uniref:Uncharacterized protein n=1 Tax=Devosia soli TaxID=361041 RepID=A0A0F5L098_9HYPH|nr:hypothetical protein [Devosia soli]KKB75856.1 hypothetical protein VW35_19025 [Devosia soli]
MIPHMTALERAFELARSGKFASVTEVKLAVSKEGYLVSQMEGPQLSKQLRALVKANRRPDTDA